MEGGKVQNPENPETGSVLSMILQSQILETIS